MNEFELAVQGISPERGVSPTGLNEFEIAVHRLDTAERLADAQKQAQAIRQAAQATPQQHATTIDLARRANLPTDVVARNQAEVDARVQQRERERLINEYPALGAVVANNQQLTGLIQNDLSTLGKVTDSPIFKPRPTAGDFPITETRGFAQASKELLSAQMAWEKAWDHEYLQRAEMRAMPRTLWEEISDPFMTGLAEGRQWLSLGLNLLNLTPGLDEKRQQAAAAHGVYLDPASEAATRFTSLGRETEKYPVPADIRIGMREISNAETFDDAFMAIINNPRATREIIFKSLGASTPSMVGGIVGSMAGPIGAATGVGLGSFAVEYTSTLKEAMSEQNVNMRDPIAFAAAVKNPEIMAAAREKALKRGVPVALFDALTAGLAGKIIAFVPKSKTGIATGVAGEASLQAGGGGAGEATAQYATDEFRPGDILMESIGEIPTAVPEAWSNYANAKASADLTAARKQNQAINAVSDAIALKSAADAVAGTEAAQLGVDGKQAVAQALYQANPDSTVTLPAAALDQALKDAGPDFTLDEIVVTAPAIRNQYATALDIGGDIVIPAGEFLATFAQSPVLGNLLEHVRVNDNLMSKAEAEVFWQNSAEELKAEVEKRLSEKNGDELFNASKDRVKQMVLTQLDAANRFTPRVNEAYAALAASHYAVRAAQLGVSPEQMFERQPMGVAAQGVAGDAYFSKAAYGTDYELRPDAPRSLPLDGAELQTLRRAAAGLEAPERGITFTVSEDGKAIVTGPARTKVPSRFQRFAEEHGLTLQVQRNRADGGYANANTAMPIEYRESGALYFGEIGTGQLDRTGMSRFSRIDTPVNNPFTLSGLKAAINALFPKTKDFAGLLEATGKVLFIGKDEIGGYLGDAAFANKNIPAVSISTEEITGVNHPVSNAEIRKIADTILDSIRAEISSGGTPLVNNETKWSLGLSAKDVRKMGNNPHMKPESSKAVIYARQLVANAILGETHQDTHGHGADAVHRFYAPALIDGKLYRVRLTVLDFSEMRGKRNLHAIRSVEIESALPGTLQATDNAEASATLAQPTTGRTVNIRQLLAGVKKEDGRSLLSSPRFSVAQADIRYSADGSRILAFVKDGITYLVHDNISQTDDDVEGLLLHEISTHALQLGRTDTEFQAILKQIEAMRKRGNKAVQAARDRVPADTKPHLVLEEQAGYLLEANPELSIVQKLIARFRALLRMIGNKMPMAQRTRWFKWADSLTVEDIVHMAQQTLKSAPETLGQAKDRGTFKAEGQAQYAKEIERVLGEAGKKGHAHDKVTLGEVAPWIAQAGQDAGLDLSGFSHVVDVAAIRHIKKRHGDKAKEAGHGQIAITDEDIRALPGIVASPDRVVFGFRTAQGLDAVVLQKQMQDGTVVYVEEVRSGNEELAAKTMWKVAATADAKNVLAHISSSLNVRNDGGVRQSVVEAPQEYNQGSRDQAQYAREYAEVEARYRGTDQWMKAPDGTQTLLNERQWVQVRTPSFKQWFGGWELAAQKLRPASTFAEAREAASVFQGKPLTSADGVVAVVSRNNLDKMLSASSVHKSESAAEHALAVANLDTLFAQAVTGWTKVDRDADTNISAIRRMFAMMRVGDKARLVKLTVKEYTQAEHENRVYSVEAVQVGEASPVPEMVAADMAEGHRLLTGPTGLADTIVERIQDFNKNGASKVVSPNGEPMVVYHGTDNVGFTSFDTQTGAWFSDRFDVAASYAGRYNETEVDGETISADDGQGVYEVYLRVENPLVVDFEGNLFADGPEGLRTDDFVNRAKRDGRDGVLIKNVRDVGEYAPGLVEDDGAGRVFVAIDPTQIKSAIGNTGAFDAANPNILLQGEGNRGSFNPDTNLITLLKAADLSTFLHEIGHFFFENDIALAAELMAKPDMTAGEQEIVNDVSALLTWHGIQGTPQEQASQWYGMDFEERRAYHERTAEAFEAYLFEGRAPSIELQPYFQKFRAWLLNVYKSLKDFLAGHPEAGKLNDEVRAVFDRMLATTEQIKLAEQGRSMMPLFETPEQAGMTPEEFAQYHGLGVDATNEAIQEVQAKGMRDMQWMRNARGREVKKLQRQSKERRSEVKMDARREIMSQPVYRAWQFLTNKLTTDDKITPIVPPKSIKGPVDPTIDTLFTAIAKLGGIDRAQLESEWGIDPKEKSPMPLFGKYVMRREGGKTIDGMAESLAENHYLEVDPHGKWDLGELEEKFMASLRGEDIYSMGVDPAILAGAEQRAGDQVTHPMALAAGRLDLGELRLMNLSEDALAHLIALKMTDENGLHPDIVAEIVGGFTSGDEMLQALSTAESPRFAIEGLTDQKMLEQYGELASPEAIERSADAAIHNDVRARVIATEINAVARATRGQSILPKAAKDFAQQIIARLKVRDLRPAQYSSAQARASKAASAALKSGDTGQVMAEKRNELINHYATRATYDAIDEIEAGVRFLRKFENDGTRKNLDADYLEQIDALLERFDLRRLSGKAVERRKTLRSWVMSRLAEGEVPDVAESLLSAADFGAYLAEVRAINEDGDYVYDDAERVKLLADYIDRGTKTPYQDMTVEQFRGLIDTVKQIEHFGRFKNKLLTARKNADLNAVKNEIEVGIRENATQEGRALPTRDDIKSRVKRKTGRFLADHIRMAMRALVMDGGKDGGPMWEYFIRPANEAEEKQVGMRIDLTERLSAIMTPLLDKVPVADRMLRGKRYDALDTSLNWQNRFAILLNMGNEGNTQRLLSGGVGGRMGLSMQEVFPLLSEFSSEELRAAQAIWDLFEEYRPEVAALELETKGKEPEWIQPRQITVRSRDGELVTLRGGYYPAVYDPALNTKVAENLEAEEGNQVARAARAQAVTRHSFVKPRAVEVHGRPLLLTLDAMYSGFDEVIHDLSFRRYAIDTNKLLRSKRIQDAMREHYGDESIYQLRNFVRDLVAGTQRLDGTAEMASAFMRKNVVLTGLGLNVTNWLMQPAGIANTVVRLGGGVDGAQWVGRGILYFARNPARAVRETMAASDFVRHRPRTRFRELNEIRNKVQVEGVRARLTPWMMWGMVRMQLIADVISWRAGYERAVHANPGIEEQEAASIADQVVRDSQGGGEMVDLSRLERGGEASKLFTTFFNFQNTGTNLAYLSANTQRSAGKRASDMALIFTVPVLVSYLVKDVLTPGGDDDDDETLKKLLVNQLVYLAGSIAFVRETIPALQRFFGEGFGGYQGPTGLKALADLSRFAEQASQGEFDDAFRKASINLLGDLTGLPAVQINRTITGVEALSEGETDNPIAAVFGVQR